MAGNEVPSNDLRRICVTMKPRRATRESWKLEEMPDARAQFHFARSFSSQEYERISLGLIPEQMEDKWFIFLEDNWLSLHRSWTGICIYRLRLESSWEGYRVAETWVNWSSKRYKTAYDSALLAFLTDRLLLGKDVPFPNPFFDVQAPAAYRHHMVGYARANNERRAY